MKDHEKRTGRRWNDTFEQQAAVRSSKRGGLNSYEERRLSSLS
jgi:hypothetical protein